jgi:hypothetical protein
MRALRDWEPGASIEIQIKRERRDKTLDVVLTEQKRCFKYFQSEDAVHNIACSDEG